MAPMWSLSLALEIRHQLVPVARGRTAKLQRPVAGRALAWAVRQVRPCLFCSRMR